MTTRMNSHSTTAAIAAAAIGLGLAATPVLAQSVGPARGFAAARATGQSVEGYEPDGRLNVFGARIEPAQGNPIGNSIGGLASGVTGVVGSTVGVVGSTVGGAVGGAVGAADAVTTGSLAPRTAYRTRGY